MNVFRELIDEEIRRDASEREQRGWQPRPQIPEGSHTIGDFVRAVTGIKDADQAKGFYNGYLEYLNQQPPTEGYTPEQVAKANIGWCFGEGMAQSQISMWVKVCEASHPVFGNVVPVPEELFQMGASLARKLGPIN